MARFSVCRGDDGGEGPSNNRSRKRQRLPCIDEDEEDAENSDAGSSGEEDAENSDARSCGEEDEETQNRGSIMISAVMEETRFEKSVNSQDSSKGKNSPLCVTLFDLDVLDCPICCEPLKIPIFQCDNGHLACSLCCTKVRNRCPSCTLPIGYIHNRAMENIIEASRVLCRNAKYGCKDYTSYGNRFTHEKLCVFNPCSCPILNCNYFSNYKDLNNHVRGNHEDDVIPFNWETKYTIILGLNEEETKIYQEENDGYVIVVQSFRTSHAALVSVSCIAPLAPEVHKLSCSLQTINGLLKQTFMVKTIQKVKNEQPEDGFMLIPSYLFFGSTMKFHLCISRDRFLVQSGVMFRSEV